MNEPFTLGEILYTVKEVATMLRLSPTAIRRRFRNEPGIIRFGNENKGHKRDYATLRIPASVVERVYRRCQRPGPAPKTDGKKKKNPIG